MKRELPTVRLRAMEPEDLDMLYHIENDRTLWDVGNTNVPYSRYALHDYIAHAAHDIYTDNQVRMMIENAMGETVGIVDVVNFNPQHLRAEIGIVIVCQHRHKGYARAAIEKIIDYARSVWHLHQLYVIIDCRNSIARSIFESMGFKVDKMLADWLWDGKKYHDACMMQNIL